MLETCGVKEALIPRLPQAGLLAAAGEAGTSITWGSLRFTAHGGTYQMCWCAGVYPCSEYEEFRFQVSPLWLIGPSPLRQDRTCVSGHTCYIDGILGEGLTNEDKLLVLDTCGQAKISVYTPLRGKVVGISSSGTTFSWATTVVTAPGGQYRMCWCPGGFTCSFADHFYVDMGELTMIGVSPLDQGRTCISGQTCSIDGITGHNLSSTDRLMVLDTCGDATAVDRFALEAFAAFVICYVILY